MSSRGRGYRACFWLAGQLASFTDRQPSRTGSGVQEIRLILRISGGYTVCKYCVEAESRPQQKPHQAPPMSTCPSPSIFSLLKNYYPVSILSLLTIVRIFWIKEINLRGCTKNTDLLFSIRKIDVSIYPHLSSSV